MTRMKRLICFSLILILLAGTFAIAAPADEDNLLEGETTLNTAHLEAMLDAARDGSAMALAAGSAAETAWNQQIAAEELDANATNFFEETEGTPAELAVEIAAYLVALGVTELDGDPVQFRIVASSKNVRAGPAREYERLGSFPNGTIVTFLGSSVNGWVNVTDGELIGWCSAIHLAPFDGTPAPNWSDPANITRPGNGNSNGTVANYVAPPVDHTQDDLFWLALTIMIEAGSDWMCDEHQRMVGNVVLNRVAHSAFPPTTIHGIVHQRGQYPWAARGVRIPISDRAWANAQWLLDGGRVAPPNVVFQSQVRQGDGTFATFHCATLGTTHFFGYIGSIG